MLVYNLSSALIEPVADSRITKCMSGMGDSIKILFGIMVACTFLFIISISILIKLSNFSLMYR